MRGQGASVVNAIPVSGSINSRALSSSRKARRRMSTASLIPALLLASCAPMSPPDNLNHKLYSPEASAKLGREHALSYMSKACAPPGAPDFMVGTSISALNRREQLTMRYSPGDRFNIYVFGSQDFSGDYVINADGTVVLPYAGPVEAIGLSNVELSSRISSAYVKSGIFIKDGLKLTVRPIQFASINVTVSGAVFLPGRHAIGGIKDSDKLDRMMSKFGDNPMDRFLPAALRGAGGVRPDADLANIKVVRRGRTFKLDWRGAITGAPVDDMPLIDGDHVEVAESGCFQSALVRPSQITPQGIRIVTSNLTYNQQNFQSGNPQLGNTLVYGARFLQGLVSAACVGGSLASNARRYAVLISRNPKTRETEVVQRSVEELVRSAHRDQINPFLMPEDSIACYDSGVTDFKEVMSTLTSVLNPASVGKSLR